MSLPSSELNSIKTNYMDEMGIGNENWDVILMNCFLPKQLNVRNRAVNWVSYELVKSCDPEICENYLREVTKSLKKVCSEYKSSGNTKNKVELNWYLISKENQEMHSKWPYNPMIFEDLGTINIDFNKINGNVIPMFLCYIFIENIPRVLFENECGPDIFPTSPFYNGRRKGESPKLSLRGRFRFRSMYLALTHLTRCQENDMFNSNVLSILDELKGIYRSEDIYSTDDGFDIQFKHNDPDSIYEWIGINYSNFEADHPGEKYTYSIRELLDRRKDDPITKRAIKR